MSERLKEIARHIEEVLAPMVSTEDPDGGGTVAELRKVFQLCLEDIDRLETVCASLTSQCERLERTVGAQSAEIGAMRERSGHLSVDLHRLQSLNSFHNNASLRLHSLSQCRVGR